MGKKRFTSISNHGELLFHNVLCIGPPYTKSQTPQSVSALVQHTKPQHATEP